MTEIERSLEALERIIPAMHRAIEALHKISEAASLTAAHMEAFKALLELGEIEDDQSSQG